MKNFILSVAFFGTIGLSFKAIDTIQKEAKLIDNSKVTYHIDENNKMEGAYSVQNTKNDVVMRGSYKDDRRTGNWYCFNDNKSMFLRYNYDQKKLLYIDTVAIKKAEITIIDKDTEVVKGASITVPICSIDQYVSLLKTEIIDTFPQNQMKYNGATDIEIVAKVDANGLAKYNVNYFFEGSKKSLLLSGKSKAFKIDWVPAMYNDKGVAAEFKVATQITFANGDGHRRFNWN